VATYADDDCVGDRNDGFLVRAFVDWTVVSFFAAGCSGVASPGSVLFAVPTAGLCGAGADDVPTKDLLFVTPRD
jgi:hypothetical protein